MAKEDRYNVNGADDGLGDSGDTASESSTDESEASSTATAALSTQQESSSSGGDATAEDMPHRVRYDSPQEDREPLTLHVATEDQQRLRELTGLAETEFDEKVWETDVKLAAFRCDISDDDAFLREMETIGYGYFD